MARQSDVAKRQPMARQELLSLPASVPLWPDAARAVGVGRTKAYELVRTGEWPTRILRLGNLIRIPTAELLGVLGIEPTEPAVVPRD